MHIALFGGSFNPPHLGHRAVLDHFLKTGQFDEIWVIPVFNHPFAKPLARFEDRLELCRRAFASLGPKVRISPLERDLPAKTGFTVDLIRFLKQKDPSIHYSLLLGSDLLRDSNRWQRFDEIQREVTVVPIPRGGEEKSPFPEISSTQIREAIRQGRPVDRSVTPAVLDYIFQKKLYS